MYEAYFGLNSRPFQLSPDPSYFYGSKGHSRALSYLKFGVFQAEGFIVVTGSIGAGKTTLLQALIEELDPARIVVVQLLSTQLDADNLLRAVALACGLDVKQQSKAETLTCIEDFLNRLMQQGKRVLLVVDEAQNLEPSAIEELRMLSNFQVRERGLIQSVLVGQPELRQMIRAPSMEQLRQRIIASYHLEAMTPQDSKAYIRHRLNKAGCQNASLFADEAFAPIFKATQGLPRKINQLCNRALLASFLAETKQIDAKIVHEVAAELDNEIGLRTPESASIFAVEPSPSTAAANSVTDPAASIALVVPRPQLYLATPLLAALTRYANLGKSKLICLDGADPQAGFSPIPPWPLIPTPDQLISSGQGDKPSDHLTQSIAQFNDYFDQQATDCVVLFDSCDASLACALVAHKRGIRIALVSNKHNSNQAVIQTLAAVTYLRHLPAQASAQAKVVGSLSSDYLRNLLPQAIAAQDTLQAANYSARFFDRRKGYGLISLSPLSALNHTLADLVHVFTTVSKVLPLIWLLRPDLKAQLLESRLLPSLPGSKIALIEADDRYREIGLIDKATFVLTDTLLTQEWSASLGRPCMVLESNQQDYLPNCLRISLDKKDILRHVSEILDVKPLNDSVDPCWDGHAADRIAADLAGNG